jgi:hypothetical protein
MDSIDRMCAVRAQPFACVKQPETMPCKVATSCRVRAATDRANQAQKVRAPSDVPLADDPANITSTAFTSSTILIATRATTLRISSKLSAAKEIECHHWTAAPSSKLPALPL